MYNCPCMILPSIAVQTSDLVFNNSDGFNCTYQLGSSNSHIVLGAARRNNVNTNKV